MEHLNIELIYIRKVRLIMIFEKTSFQNSKDENDLVKAMFNGMQLLKIQKKG